MTNEEIELLRKLEEKASMEAFQESEKHPEVIDFIDDAIKRNYEENEEHVRCELALSMIYRKKVDFYLINRYYRESTRGKYYITGKNHPTKGRIGIDIIKEY